MPRKRKDPSELSPAYRKRIESYERRNPGASRAEAGGKKKKTPTPSKGPKPSSPKTPKPKAPKRTNAPMTRPPRKTPAEWSPSYRKRIETFYRRNPDASLSEARGHAITQPKESDSELTWTMWSQKRKEGNLSLREAMGDLSPDQSREGRVILKQMIKETKDMYEKYPAGTTAYYDAQDRLKELYKRLEKMGLVARSGDLTKGDVGYH